MLKLIAIFLFAVSVQAQGACKVYGITDSPQKLTCTFPATQDIIRLTCQRGTYHLNTTPVNVAFHMDVESGPSPLVFKAQGQQLTVTMESKRITAEFERSKVTVQGTCREL